MLGVVKKAYEKSPMFVKRAYARIPFGLRMGRGYRQMRRFLRESQHWTRDELRAYQNRQIRKLIEHAYENVPYYRGTFDARGLKPEDVQTVEDLQKLPFLTKADVKRHFTDLRARNVKGFNVYDCTTGGTSGEPLGFYLDNSSYAFEWAFMHDQWSRVGYSSTERKATFRGAHIDVSEAKVWEDNPIYKERRFSIYHITKDRMATYLKGLRNWRPTFVHGYPSALYRFAALVDLMQEDITDVRVVLCGSEQLYQHQRRMLESVFGARVFSWYGQSEKVILAGECEYSSHYHAYPQYGVSEIVRSDGSPCAPGEVGELVGTGFLNRGMPLIRYRTGDFGSLSSVECACGRRYPILESVIGRKQDHLVTKSGRLIPVTGMLFGAHLPEYARIERIQLEQKEPGRAIVRVVPGAACQARDLEGVVRAFEDICDGECRFDVEQVEEIATTESGKYRYVIQNIDIDNVLGDSKANEADHPEVSDG